MPTLTDLPASRLDDEQRAIHRVADRYLRAFTDSLTRALESAADQLSVDDVQQVLLTGTQDQLTGLVDEALLTAAVGRVTKQEADTPVLETFGAILIDGARESADELPREVREAGVRLAGRLDLTNPAAVDRARRLAGQLISRISFESREAIRSIISAGLAEGTDIPAMAREVRQVVGLDSRSARALRSYRRKLSENLGAGRTFDLRSRFSLAPARSPVRVDSAAERLEAMSGKYRERLLRHRARTIARHESITASNQGQDVLWRLMQREGLIDPTRAKRVWISTMDDRTCSICLPLDGQVIEFLGEWVSDTLQKPGAAPEPRTDVVVIGTSPPSHVACRCSQGLRFD